MSTTLSPSTSGLGLLTPGTWTVDPAHSSVGFVARHLMISKVRGSFRSFAGTVTIGEDPLASTVEATVELASVSTGDDGRDAHLRGADFFDVENNPTMTFRSSGVRLDGNDYLLDGDLTIKGVTEPVTFELEFDGVNRDPWGNEKAGFSASTEINRKDFGLTWNVALETGGVVVGEKVKIVLDVQAVKAVA
jgi:polyisoprenoid-binding protein YceI